MGVKLHNYIHNFFVKYLAIILAILAPVKTVMISVGFLIVADLITGVWASKKKRVKITSARMSHSVTKMAAYQIAVITGFVCEKYLISSAVPITQIVSGLIGATELLSCYENINIITGVDFKKKIFDYLQPGKISKEDKKDKK